MAVAARKAHPPRLLTKRQKLHKRVARVHKAIARKKIARKQHTSQVRARRLRLRQAQDEEAVPLAEPVLLQGAPIQAELGLMALLGLDTDQGGEGAGRWEQVLERKLREADEKSIDNPEVKRVYSQIGKIFTRYRSGKVPKAFKIIPNLEHWRQVIELTRPDQWTSHAMLQAVSIFASNFDPVRAEQFYRSWLVPAVRRDLSRSKKLNCHLFEALQKALYKTNAWFKGILFEFCSEQTLLRETKVIESIIAKMSIPVISASVAMFKLMEMPPTTPVLHYLSAFLNKHYTLPRRVLCHLVDYLLSFQTHQDELTIVWHGLLLNLAKQYGQCLDELQKASLIQLANTKTHKLITPEILKHLS